MIQAMALPCRIAAPCCSLLAAKVLKQRPATVKRAADVCLAFVELEQAEAVEVGLSGIVSFCSSCVMYCIALHQAELATSDWERKNQ